MNIAPSEFSGQRILITGASGFIGSHLCRRMLGCGAELHAVSRKTHNAENAGLRWWRVDLADADAVCRIVSKIRPDVVFHLASHVDGGRNLEFVLPTLQSNLLSTVHLLIAMARFGCGRLVLAGSMEEPCRAETPVPCSPYAASKWAASAYAGMFHSLYGIPTIALRIFMVYGPGQRDTRKLIPSVILSLLSGEAPRLTSGNRPIDWIFVEDVIDSLIAAAAATDVGGATLDVGSGTAVTIRETVERLVQLVNPSIAPQFGAIEDRPRETVRLADTAATERRLGWSIRTPLDTGLSETVGWYQKTFAEGHRYRSSS